MSIDDLLGSLRADARFLANVAAWRVEAARPPEAGPFPAAVDPGLRAALAARGVASLYAHQAEAVGRALSGEHVVVVTPTASGKTLCYNLPVLQKMRLSPGARALYVFPTKALSQDQVAELSGLIGALGDPWKTYTYDGDTPGDARRLLREGGHVIVTNPCMLHAGILPNHPKWTALFQNLEFVVVDELHTYRGVFGSHFANVLRRLRRVCAHYGSRPVFIAASATIGNPRELAERLVGLPFALVDRSGAPRGERHHVLYNPPIVHRELGLRAAALEEVRRIARRFLPYGVQMIVFGRSRNQVEVLLKYMKDAAKEAGVPADAVRGYRGGYLPKLRREIERGLRAGDVRVVVATNALELGVDIGSLDVAVLTGYPGSAASYFQQAGRAGRRGRPSLVVMVGRSLPIDQYLLRHPEELLDRPRERAVIDPENLLIRMNHVKCSAFEVPYGDAELAREETAGATREILEYLRTDARVLHRAGERWYWMAEAYPADGVSLTAADIDSFVVYDVEERRVMAEVDRPSAMTEIHENAIYGWQGEQYVIERLDYENRRAYARKVSIDYYTEAETERKIRALSLDAAERWGDAYELRRGDVEVTTKATVFKKIKFYTRENVGAGEIRLPAEVVDTTCCWITFEARVAAECGLFGPDGRALLSLRNLLKNVVPLFIRCDPRDVHVWTESRAPSWGDRPTIYVFDHMPAGTGLAERLFVDHREVLGVMRAVIEECPCPAGCPGCVGVEDEVGPSGKAVARALLARMLGAAAPTPIAETGLAAPSASDLADEEAVAAATAPVDAPRPPPAPPAPPAHGDPVRAFLEAEHGPADACGRPRPPPLLREARA
jgi:DEAD/DEAH box helicase domain-containing protein